MTDSDWSTFGADPMNDQYTAPGDTKSCTARLTGATCVEGTCRRGAFNFWTVVPRNAADIVSK